VGVVGEFNEIVSSGKFGVAFTRRLGGVVSEMGVLLGVSVRTSVILFDDIDEDEGVASDAS